jgi:hypothetical protein
MKAATIPVAMPAIEPRSRRDLCAAVFVDVALSVVDVVEDGRVVVDKVDELVEVIVCDDDDDDDDADIVDVIEAVTDTDVAVGNAELVGRIVGWLVIGEDARSLGRYMLASMPYWDANESATSVGRAGSKIPRASSGRCA